ncbi:MAG: XdhC family protein, partial [Peptoniphilus grossensis]
PKDFASTYKFNKNTYILICTPDYDEEVLENVIDKDYKFLGMIGSKRKVKRVFDNLKEKGVSEDLLKKVHAPVGYDIDDGSVEEIAISILSLMISIKNNKVIEN